MDFTSLKVVPFLKREVKNKGGDIFVIMWKNFDIFGVPLVKEDAKS